MKMQTASLISMSKKDEKVNTRLYLLRKKVNKNEKPLPIFQAAQT